MADNLIGPDWLFRELRSQDGTNRLLILDCRAHSDFLEAHVRGSVSLAIPSIMLRRLAAGKVDLISTIRCLDLRNRVEVFLHGDKSSRGTFVLIGDSTDPIGHQGETIQVLNRRLRSNGGSVAILVGKSRHHLYSCSSYHFIIFSLNIFDFILIISFRWFHSI